MAEILNSFIKKLINKPYQYEVIIYFGNLNIYKFFTAKNVSSNFSQELETVHSFGSLEPKDIYAKKKDYSFSIELQNGELQLLLTAARLGYLTNKINTILDFPKNTTLAVVNKFNGNTILYKNCVFFSEKEDKNVSSIEIITQIEFKCLNVEKII